MSFRVFHRRQALLAVLTGETIVAVVMVLNGTIGARLHVGFPVLARSSFGFWFSYFAVISRIVLSMIWSGITSYVGSQCIYQVTNFASTMGATLIYSSGRC